MLFRNSTDRAHESWPRTWMRLKSEWVLFTSRYAAMFGVLCFLTQLEISLAWSMEIPVPRGAHIEVQQRFGELVVQTWPQDKVRLELQMTDEFRAEFRGPRPTHNFGLTHRQVPGRLEFAVEAPDQIPLSQEMALIERAPTILLMRVPLKSRLQVAGIRTRVRIEQLQGELEFLSLRGLAEIYRANLHRLSVSAMEAKIRIDSSEIGEIRVFNRSGLLEVDRTRIQTGLIEGALRANRVQVDQEISLLAHDESIQVRDSDGNYRFQSDTGPVRFELNRGSVQGISQGAQVIARVAKWDYPEMAVIESATANVLLFLGKDFRGDVSLRSNSGRVDSDFDLVPSKPSYGPPFSGWQDGRVGPGPWRIAQWLGWDRSFASLTVASGTGSVELRRYE